MADISTSLRLAELICARLCHDLSGLLGTLSSALDLATEEAAASEPLILAREAAEALVHRLRLRRAAWGPDGGPLDLAAVAALAAGAGGGRPIAVDLSALPPDTVFPAPDGRMVLNILLLAGDSLPGGGTVRLTGAAADLFLHIDGPRAAWPAGLVACLADAATAVAALDEVRNVQMPLTALLAHGLGLKLSPLMSPAACPAVYPLRLGRP